MCDKSAGCTDRPNQDEKWEGNYPLRPSLGYANANKLVFLEHPYFIVYRICYIRDANVDPKSMLILFVLILIHYCNYTFCPALQENIRSLTPTSNSLTRKYIYFIQSAFISVGTQPYASKRILKRQQTREISCYIEILLSVMYCRMVLMVVCWLYRMPFDANGCVLHYRMSLFMQKYFN